LTPDEVVLRPLRWWDIADAHALEVQLFPDTWSQEVFWSELAAPGRCYVVVQDPGGALLGYAGLAVTGTQADVQTIAVAPSAQGRGLGAVLLDALLAAALDAGATSVMLEVRADNAGAINLYRRAGFEQIAVRRRYYQPGDVDALIMRLRAVQSPSQVVTTTPSVRPVWC